MTFSSPKPLEHKPPPERQFLHKNGEKLSLPGPPVDIGKIGDVRADSAISAGTGGGFRAIMLADKPQSVTGLGPEEPSGFCCVFSPNLLVMFTNGLVRPFSGPL
ncbi:hypothetical protein GWI33_003067 [Rhynchophorus ferrugineus]|uniref:Uncharacterized protein n=1 Tax=Rhynchophorus ferrugineus TaxID=354439 RepID=A0A834MJ95_RHYFE|nr:hypothetical protein GWI33_003067 [Rhynchophorus ferrugineus]